MPYQDNSYDCGVFVCLLVHLMNEECKKQNGGHQRERSESLSDFENGLGIQQQATEGQPQHAVNTDRNQLDPQDLFSTST